MCRYFETIRISNGEPCHLEAHNRRMNRTRSEVWQETRPLDLASALQGLGKGMELAKAKVVYGRDGFVETSVQPYAMRSIKSLKLVADDDICYAHKGVDRSQLDRLHALRGHCDDIIIVKQGLLTDTSFTNIALFDGHTWATPRRPLLPGTMRERLIAGQRIVERDIRADQLGRYEAVALFNAMLDFGRLVVDIGDVYGH